MARLNKVGFTVEAGVSIVDFVENVLSPRRRKETQAEYGEGVQRCLALSHQEAGHCGPRS